MNYLLINTANKILRILVSKDNKIYSISNNAQKKHNEILLSLIDEALKDAKLDLSEIHAFGVVVGPGSFTGIRVGISTIKAFKDVFKKNCVGLNNLELLSRMSDFDQKYFAIFGSNDSYYFAQKNSNSDLNIYSRNLTYDEVFDIAKNQKIAVFEGEDFGKIMPKKVMWNDQVWLQVFEEKLEEKKFDLQPIYYQLSQAEKEKICRTNLLISFAKNDDISEILKIDNICFEDKWSEQTYVDELKNSRIILYAKIENEVVGFVDVVNQVDELSIMRIAVLPDYRNQGIATKLIKKIEEIALQMTIKKVSLEAEQKNFDAICLYSKLGYGTRRVRKNYYKNGSDAIEMSKEIF